MAVQVEDDVLALANLDGLFARFRIQILAQLDVRFTTGPADRLLQVGPRGDGDPISLRLQRVTIVSSWHAPDVKSP